MIKSNKIKPKTKNIMRIIRRDREVYLDYSAATPVDHIAIKKMQQVLCRNFANPASIHSFGIESKKILENARKEISEILHARSNEIIFTSGATEANNLAIFGVINCFHNTISPTSPLSFGEGGRGGEVGDHADNLDSQIHPLSQAHPMTPSFLLPLSKGEDGWGSAENMISSPASPLSFGEGGRGGEVWDRWREIGNHIGKMDLLRARPHIVTTNIEHVSILEVCQYLENLDLEKTNRAEITYVPVEANGIIDPKKIKKAIKENTILVSVMYANNEIGTIQPIREIGKQIRLWNLRKNKKVLFHSDAAQAVGYLPISVEKLGIDLMSISSEKIYGPKGSGLLFVKNGIIDHGFIEPMIRGGGQEFNIRSGAENLPSIVGFSEAFKINEKIKESETKRLTKLRDYFINKLINSKVLRNIRIIINGDLNLRLPNNINISVSKIPSDLLVLEFSARGIYISEKSACKSGTNANSHVILALRKNDYYNSANSLRFSLGRQSSIADINYVIKEFEKIVLKLYKWYN